MGSARRRPAERAARRPDCASRPFEPLRCRADSPPVPPPSISPRDALRSGRRTSSGAPAGTLLAPGDGPAGASRNGNLCCSAHPQGPSSAPSGLARRSRRGRHGCGRRWRGRGERPAGRRSDARAAGALLRVVRGGRSQGCPARTTPSFRTPCGRWIGARGPGRAAGATARGARRLRARHVERAEVCRSDGGTSVGPDRPRVRGSRAAAPSGTGSGRYVRLKSSGVRSGR